MGGQVFVSNFLGELIQIEPELTEYVGYCGRFGKIRTQLMSQFLSYAKKGSHEFYDPLKVSFKREAEGIIRRLAKDNILNVTVDELLESNNGYKKYLTDYDDGIRELAKIMKKYFEALLSGIEITERTAYSKITGSNTMLFSNDLLAHTVFAAVESSIMSAQASQAQKEYSKSINTLIDSNTEADEAERMRFSVNVWYPKITEDINLFVYNLMEAYLLALEKKELFNYSIVKAYNVKRSQQLLDNLKVVEDKQGVLIEAFKECPINGLVYQACLDNDLLTIDIYETAKQLDMSNNLDDLILKAFNQACDKPLMNKQYTGAKNFLPLASRVLNTSLEDATKKYFKKSVSTIEQRYDDIRRCLSNRKELYSFLQTNVNTKISQLIKLDSDTIKTSIQKYLSNVISKDNYQVLVENQSITSNSNIFLNGAENDLSIINNQWEDALVQAVNEFIIEAKTRQVDYEQAERKYKDFLNEQDKKITELSNEISSLGLLAFSKKKKLKEDIENINGKKESYRTELNIDGLKKAFEEMA